MSDDPPPDRPRDERPALDHQPPGAADAGRSQWITDDQPGAGWLVGCLAALTVLGVLASAAVTVAAMMMGC